MPPNRLAREKSPYLLQHANNPVDWYPWGEEAFEKARSEDKPIFLSIGYSTCHWCHVMEHESFENEQVAAILNEQFVPIKVDREERPDVDRIYMLFVQASTGSGGWPMSVFLTPALHPFFGGTYFPPDNRYGRPGFRVILQNLAKAWTEDRPRILASGAQVLEQLKTYAAEAAGEPSPIPDAAALDSGFNAFRRLYDSKLGGFGGAPKFPRPSVHNFLLRYHASLHGSAKHEDALEMVLATLRAMARGGMHDQLGGGFHRYSVDDRWFVPHFEKMLYDQAQLAVSYLEAFQLSRDGQYASVARDIFSYVQGDLTSPDGAFYSAEDADSAPDAAHPNQKKEGSFYVWTRNELEDALGSADAAILSYRCGVEPSGNVEEDPHGEFGGQNILYRAHSVEATAAHFNIKADEARTVLKNAVIKLQEIRSHRPRPHLDDKVLTAWNGMMISAFAKGAQVLDEPRYADAARAAANFVRRNLWDAPRKVLLRRHRAGESAIDGFLDDYACFILALLDLYENGFDAHDLQFAIQLAERAIELFEDRDAGGFFSTAGGESDLVLRLKDDYDGAEPSGNSSMAMALVRLARMTGRDDFRAAAERTLAAFSSRMKSGSTGVPQMLAVLATELAPPMEIVFATPAEEWSRDETLHDMLRTVHRYFLPSAVVLMGHDAPTQMPPVDNRTTAYVCQNYACNLPVTNAHALEKSITRE